MGIGGVLTSADYFEDEGDELELVSKSICQKLAAQGIEVTGEEVRRWVRKSGMPVEKIDGKLFARSDDIAKFVRSVVSVMRANAAKRSAAA